MKGLYYSIFLLAVTAIHPSINAQNVGPWKPLADSLIANQISVTSDDMMVFESEFIKATEAKECHQQIALTFKIARGIAKGKSSVLFPSLLEDIEKCPEAKDPHLLFFIGNAFFSLHNFDQAISFYEGTLGAFTNDEEFSYFTLFNYAGALNNAGDSDRSIQMLDSLIQSNNPFVSENRHNVLLNLGAMQMSNMQFAEAQRTFGKIDRSQLELRFDEILHYNELILFQLMGETSAADSVWQEAIRDIPFERLPAGVYTAATKACLLGSDLAYFERWKNHLRSRYSNSNDFLMHIEIEYHPLFQLNMDEESSISKWNSFAEWEMEHQAYLREKLEKAELPEYDSIIEGLEASVIREREAKESSQKLNWISAVAILLAFSIYQLTLARMRRKRIVFIEKSLEKPLPKDDSVSVILKDADLRTLSEAISKGTRISDASLVIRKLRMIMDAEKADNEKETFTVTSKKIFDKLNASEKSVADYLANGFDAKEIARLMKVSTGYVYNVRSRIRIKLEIPEEVNLNAWLKEVSSGNN